MLTNRPLLQGGTFLFPNYFKELEYSKFDISADYDDSIPLTKSDGKPVPRTYRAYLKYISNWATMPDFFRVSSCHLVLSAAKLLQQGWC